MAARDSRGRFKKSSGARRSRRSSRTTAITTTGARPIVIRQSAGTPARRGGGRRRGTSAHVGERVRKGVAIGGFFLGYLDANQPELLNKLPKVKGSSLATLALGLHFLAKPRPGSYVDHVATAATAVAAFQLGQKGLNNAAPWLSGDDDGASW